MYSNYALIRFVKKHFISIGMLCCNLRLLARVDTNIAVFIMQYPIYHWRYSSPQGGDTQNQETVLSVGC